MSNLLEYRKIKGKKLVIKFKFDSYNDAWEHRMYCHSLDKYMSLDVWKNLYEKISKPIDCYVTNESNVPSKESIPMRRSQLNLDISWQKCDAHHLSLLGLETEKVYSYLMEVKVRAVSKVNEFEKSRSTASEQDASMENNNLPSSVSNCNLADAARSSENHKSIVKDRTEEKIASTDTVCSEVESIELATSKTEIRTALPKSGSLELIAHLPYQPRKANPMTSNEIDDFFCDEAYDAYEERQNAIIQTEICDQEFPQFSFDRKLPEKRVAEPEKAIVYAERGIEKKRKKNELHAETADRIGNEAPKITDRGTTAADRFIDLKDLTIEELTGTFETFSPVLRKMFNDNKSEGRVKTSTEYDHTIMAQIIETKQFHALIDKLTEELVPSDARGMVPVVPQFDELFWEVLVPEWVLLVFMVKYDLTRGEALEQLQKQDDEIMDTQLGFNSN